MSFLFFLLSLPLTSFIALFIIIALLTTETDLSLRWAALTTTTLDGFYDKTVLVTGASAGIGKSIAYHLYHKGQVKVLILSARRENELIQVKQQLESSSAGGSSSSNTRIIILPLDLADLDSLPQKIAQAKELSGSPTIDILINNGGISQRQFAEQSSFEVDELLLKVNFLAAVRLTKSLLPDWLSPNNNNNNSTNTFRIINTVSLAGKIGSPLRTAYSASKFAMIGHFDCLRQELASKNVIITNACPGSVNTDISKNALMGNINKKFASTDENIAHGMNVDKAAWYILIGSQAELPEIWLFGVPKEKIGAYFNQYAPGLFQSVLKQMKMKIRLEAEQLMMGGGGE
jgi:dehydrogenase/reductase SDR family protein 7B